jgi:hypothetical protein
MSTEEYTFPTRFHEVASKIYSKLPRCRDLAAFILDHLDENKVDHLEKVYMNRTQFTRATGICNLWRYWYTEDEDALSGIGVDMLIYMLDAYTRDKALAVRRQKLNKGKI